MKHSKQNWSEFKIDIWQKSHSEPHLLSRLAFNSIKAKCAKDGQINWKQCVWRTPNLDGFRQRNVSNNFIRFFKNFQTLIYSRVSSAPSCVPKRRKSWSNSSMTSRPNWAAFVWLKWPAAQHRSWAKSVLSPNPSPVSTLWSIKSRRKTWGNFTG